DNVDKEKMNDVNFFKQAKIGDLGQVFWMNAAWMKDENGTRIQCEYDLSPELVYHYSSMVNE
ncbi:MAG: hypothetical protein NTX03_01910, partial [Bacteroidetes bacterium]|nr:hypothetical protein [Bacteroidota bacterium]